MITNVVVTALYFWIVYTRYVDGDPEKLNDLSFWATAVLIMIPIQMGSHIVVHIIHAIVSHVSNKEQEPGLTDERDKLIELKSTRNSHYAFMLGFLGAMFALSYDAQAVAMFAILVGSGLVSSLVSEVSQIYYYRRGV